MNISINLPDPQYAIGTLVIAPRNGYPMVCWVLEREIEMRYNPDDQPSGSQTAQLYREPYWKYVLDDRKGNHWNRGEGSFMTPEELINHINTRTLPDHMKFDRIYEGSVEKVLKELGYSQDWAKAGEPQ